MNFYRTAMKTAGKKTCISIQLLNIIKNHATCKTCKRIDYTFKLSNNKEPPGIKVPPEEKIGHSLKQIYDKYKTKTLNSFFFFSRDQNSLIKKFEKSFLSFSFF